MTRVTGSKNGNAIRAKFPIRAKQSKQIQDSTCLILVSIKNNRFCSGKWFAAILQSSLHTFKSVTFLIGDELQLYNYILESEGLVYTEEELKNKISILRDEWWLENEATFLLLFEGQIHLYNKLKNNLANKTVLEKIIEINKAAEEGELNFKVTTWCDWLASCPSYLEEEITLKAQYESVELLRSSLEESAEEFALRKSKTNPNLYPKAVEIAENFLIEESPCIMIIGARLGYDFVAYTGKMTKVFKATHQHFIQNNFFKKMQWIDINFEKYYNSIPQPQQEVTIKPVSKNIFFSESLLEIIEEDVVEK